MAIYDQPVRILIRDMIAELAPQKGIVFSREAAVEWFTQNYPEVKEGTISAHLVRFSTNAPSRLHHTVRPEEDMLFQIGRSEYRLYDASTDPAPIHSKVDVNTIQGGSKEPEDSPSPSEFAYESDLRDFLAKNLKMLETGLMLYQEEGIRGIEFPVGGRYIDILARDAQGGYVVIELKVSKGYDRVIGQILRYMAWIQKHHASPGQNVRGIIAARVISEDLKLAASYLPDVALYEYTLSVSVSEVGKE